VCSSDLIINGYNTGISGLETTLTKSSLVTNAGTSPLAYDLFTDIVDSKGSLKWWGYKYPYLNLYWSLNLPGEKVGGDMLAQIKSLNDGEGVDIDRFGYYLTLGELLQKIKTFCIPKLSNGYMLDIDTNVDETIMSAYPNQISLNPKIALVKPKFLDDLSLNNYNEFSANKTGIKSYWDFAKRMNDWMVTENDGSIIYGKTLNVYLNYDFISNALDKVTKKGEIYLFKFLQEICDGINSALGGVPNLEPIISDDNVITIQDQNRIRGIENSSFKSKFDGNEVSAYLGIRPEHIYFEKINPDCFEISLKSELLEYTGHEQIVTFDYLGQQVLGKFSSTFDIEINKDLKLNIDTSQISLFVKL
jgi:hypothetical protein